LVKTTIEVDDVLWRIVRIKADKENIPVPKALERILEEYIKNHGDEYGYPPEEIERRQRR